MQLRQILTHSKLENSWQKISIAHIVAADWILPMVSNIFYGKWIFLNWW